MNNKANNKEKKNKLIKVIFKVIKKRFKLGHLLLVAILLVSNSFAWFIYMNKIDSDIDVKVKAWNVSFRFDNETMTDYVKFDVSEIYPGMNDYTEELTVKNDGEVSAKLYYEILSVSIFGENYEVSDDFTSKQLESTIDEKYPFKIKITTSKEVIDASGGNASFIVTVSWPYETVNEDGNLNDDEDTYWGNMAYQYKENNPDSPCIRLNIKLSATQINE